MPQRPQADHIQAPSTDAVNCAKIASLNESGSVGDEGHGKQRSSMGMSLGDYLRWEECGRVWRAQTDQVCMDMKNRGEVWIKYGFLL